MANKKAIINSHIDANSEIVTHKMDALIIDPRGSKSIKNAIINLANDVHLRASNAANACNKLNSYDEKVNCQ